MAAVSYSEFMPDPFLLHDLVHLHVSVQQAVVITAINVITNFGQVVLIPVGKDLQDIVLLPVFVSRPNRRLNKSLCDLFFLASMTVSSKTAALNGAHAQNMSG